MHGEAATLSAAGIAPSTEMDGDCAIHRDCAGAAAQELLRRLSRRNTVGAHVGKSPPSPSLPIVPVKAPMGEEGDGGDLPL